MSEELVTKVQEMLKEEKWTRTAISSYTTNNLRELAEVVDEAHRENCADEIKTLCDEQLAHTKDSIIALYISGMLGLSKGTLDNSNLESLVEIFKNNHKEDVVEDLCKSIIDKDDANRFALRTLADSYKAKKDGKDSEDKLWEINRKLFQSDPEDADVAKALALHKEKENQKDEAISYYKEALLRYVNAKNSSETEAVWKKLIALIWENPEQAKKRDEIDFFMLVQRKVAKTSSTTKSASLLEDLYEKYKENELWDTAIDILKLILSYDPKDTPARRNLSECYLAKYKDHSHVNEYIASSNLNQSFRNVFEAINDFEKHIAFDVKHFVFHRTWRVGLIQEVNKDMLTINFGQNGIKTMSLKMAIDALQPLPKNHIWVIKATRSPEALRQFVKPDDAFLAERYLSARAAEDTDKIRERFDKDLFATLKEKYADESDESLRAAIDAVYADSKALFAAKVAALKNTTAEKDDASEDGKKKTSNLVKGAKREFEKLIDKKTATYCKNAKRQAKITVLKTIIQSFDNCCDMKRIKAELVDTEAVKDERGKITKKEERGILTSSEWTSWGNEAKKILEEENIFGVNPDNISEYVVRAGEISQEEKLSNEFKAQKQFFPKIEILMRFLNDKDNNIGSNLFADMLNYFTSYVKSFSMTNDANEQVVASYLVVQAVNPQYIKNLDYTFERLYKRIESPRKMYETLKDIKLGTGENPLTLRKAFLRNIRTLPDWVEKYIYLFPTVLDKDMIDTLIKENHTEQVQELAINAFEDTRGYRDATLYFFDKAQGEPWFADSNGAPIVEKQKQLVAILNIIAQAYREKDNHVNTTENTKVITYAENLLFKNNTLIDFMLESDMDTLTHLYTLAEDIPELAAEKKTLIRNSILEKYPDYKFHKAEEKVMTPKGMLVTQKKKAEKENYLKKLVDELIPENAKEIEDAHAKGDLKENAEYIAAKEHQHYLNKQLAQLQSEIGRAVLFDPTTATTSYVSFGTVVTLANKETNKEETYTILGPWESDTSNGIISYMSPFGSELLGHKTGEDLDFEINGHHYAFTVKGITLAKL